MPRRPTSSVQTRRSWLLEEHSKSTAAYAWRSEAMGTFTIGNGAGVDATVNAPNNVPQGRKWVILQSDKDNGLTGSLWLPAAPSDYATTNDYDLTNPAGIQGILQKK